MKNRCEPRNDPRCDPGISKFSRVIHSCCVVLLTMFALVSARGQARLQARSDGPALVSEPAVPAILAAFDRYDVVAMPADHGLKDLDDLILTLVRNPAFSKKVNDIEIECGNSLYQDILDRYTTGADVGFRDAQAYPGYGEEVFRARRFQVDGHRPPFYFDAGLGLTRAMKSEST